jgi:hypothetical protein
MITSHRPTVQLPESFQWPPSAALPTPAAGPSPKEIEAIVTTAIEHLGQRLQGTHFTVSPLITIGTTRVVLTVSARDHNESFVVKVATRESHSYQKVSERAVQHSPGNTLLAPFLALEEEISCDGQRRVAVAPYVKGETFLSYATQRGLSESDWDIAYKSIPRLMEAIWREFRSPHDASLGLTLDHHFDNIIVGVKQPPFHDGSGESKRRIVFVDGRDDGAYHPQQTLEAAIEDFRALLKRHAFMRTAWG